MKDPYLLHVFAPTRYVSPFDINMAYEAHYDAVIPYNNVTLEEIYALTQDTIFSRSPEGVKRTGIFIGGRDFDLAFDMLEAARNAMVPPFAVSVLADPSGAITTAAAMVALAESWLVRDSGTDFSGRTVAVLGGTGPVGACVGLLAARCGAKVRLISNRGRAQAETAAKAIASRFHCTLEGADGGSPEALASVLAHIPEWSSIPPRPGCACSVLNCWPILPVSGLPWMPMRCRLPASRVSSSRTTGRRSRQRMATAAALVRSPWGM